MRIAIGFTLMLASGLYAQQPQQPAVPPPQPPVQPQVPRTLPPGIQQQQQLPPGLQNRPLPPGLQQTPPPTVPPNRGVFVPTNALGRPIPQAEGFRGRYMQTNAPGRVMTNLAGTTITNPAGPAPTNTLAATNVMTGTNGLVGTNSINITNRIEISVQDRAVTPADQTLIVRIRQSVEPVLPSTASWAPVRFVANQGVVLVSGEVGDSQQKQQIVTIVSRTPGVARVVDDLQIVTASVGSNTISLNESGSSPSAQSATPNAMANQDQAFTIADRNLITELHQVVQPVIGNAEPVSPINFVANNGVITLLGSVPNDLQRQQVVRLVQRTPGVVRVVDQLQVNVQANATPGQIRTAPTPAPSTLNTPVPMPTGRLNEQNRTYPPSAPTPQQLQNTNTAVR